MATPDYRLQARSGVPVGELLLAQRQLDPPRVWTSLEYFIAATLLLMQAGAFLFVASKAVEVFWGP